MTPQDEHGIDGVQRRMREEMLESYAPLVEIPEETRKGVRGCVVDGDVLPDGFAGPHLDDHDREVL